MGINIESVWFSAAAGETTTNLTDSQTGWSGDTGNWTFTTDEQVYSAQSSLGGNIRTAIWYSGADIEGAFEIQMKLQNTNTGGMIGIYPADAQGHFGTTGNTWGMGMFSDSSNHWVSGNPSNLTALGVQFGNTIYTMEEGYENTTNVGSISTSDVYAIKRSSNGVITFEIDDEVEYTQDETYTDDMRVGLGSAAEGVYGHWEYVRLIQ